MDIKTEFRNVKHLMMGEVLPYGKFYKIEFKLLTEYSLVSTL